VTTPARPLAIPRQSQPQPSHQLQSSKQPVVQLQQQTRPQTLSPDHPTQDTATPTTSTRGTTAMASNQRQQPRVQQASRPSAAPNNRLNNAAMLPATNNPPTAVPRYGYTRNLTNWNGWLYQENVYYKNITAHTFGYA
jgi:hypothetical protein